MSKKDNSNELKKPRGVPSRKKVYAKVAMHAFSAIGVLVEEMTEPTKMSSSRVAAARTLLNKVLPDLKAADIKMEGSITTVTFDQSLKQSG